jgi:hypothetical protein
MARSSSRPRSRSATPGPDIPATPSAAYIDKGVSCLPLRPLLRLRRYRSAGARRSCKRCFRRRGGSSVPGIEQRERDGKQRRADEQAEEAAEHAQDRQAQRHRHAGTDQEWLDEIERQSVASRRGRRPPVFKAVELAHFTLPQTAGLVPRRETGAAHPVHYGASAPAWLARWPVLNQSEKI